MDTRKDIVNGILDRKGESFPLLALYATSPECWYDDSIDGWYTVCAIHLLAKMKHYRAQLAINSALLESYDDVGDWLTVDLPYVLAYMGVGAIPTLTALMQYDDADMFVRIAAAQALVMIIRKHPKAKSGVVASIMDTVQKDPDIAVRSFLVSALVDLLDPDLYGYFRDLMRTDLVADDILTMDGIDRRYETRRPAYDAARDPMYLFEPQYKKTIAYIS